MQTNIILFLLFSIIVAIIMYFFPHDLKKHGFFVINVTFYILCDIKFIALIIVGIVWSFFVAKKIAYGENNRRNYLIIAIVPLVAILFFFKYYNFFLPSEMGGLHIVMPLGISYYTFKIISYVVEVYWNKDRLEEDWWDYANYIMFFPQMICGPITRSQDIMPQMKFWGVPEDKMLVDGIQLIVSGLFKKVVIADRLNPYVNTIWGNYTAYPFLALWLAAFFYTVQIYCDFAGYSEIVIGICKLIGIECKANFNLPYFAYSIKDFWSRWHISLSSWLRDYIYIPLGGNRRGKLRKVINTLVTFGVSGIWHGNTLSYIAWGLYHGIFNCIPVKKSDNKGNGIVQVVLCFVIVMFGWILFRAETMTDALLFVKNMFMGITINANVIIASILPFTGDYSCMAYLLVIFLFVFVLFVFEYRELMHKDRISDREKNVKMVIYMSCILYFGIVGQNNFLYANF